MSKKTGVLVKTEALDFLKTCQMESKLANCQVTIVKFFILAKKSGQKPGFKKQKWAEP